MGRGLSKAQKNVLGWIWEQYGGVILISDLIQDFQGSNFSRLTVGKKEYDRIHSIFSRTISRLRQRALLRIFKEVDAQATLLMLTDDGIELAKQLDKH